MKRVAIIPARAGSKGIPGKNILEVGGQPLLAYTALAATGSKCFERVILSTDSEEIAQVGRSFGLEVPYLRSASLAQDDTPILPVLQDLVSRLGLESYDGIALLQATSPLRNENHIREAMKLFETKNADSVVSVIRIPHHFHPWSILRRSLDGTLSPWFEGETAQVYRRQDKPAAFARNGPAILITKPSVLARGKLYGDKTLGYEMSEADSLDIDGPKDLEHLKDALAQR